MKDSILLGTQHMRKGLRANLYEHYILGLTASLAVRLIDLWLVIAGQNVVHNVWNETTWLLSYCAAVKRNKETV